MSTYICPNCNNDFKQKSNYINHIEKRKKPCQQNNHKNLISPQKSTISPQKSTKITQKFIKNTQIPIEITQNPIEIAQNPIEISQNPIEISQNPIEIAQNPIEIAQNPIENVKKISNITIKEYVCEYCDKIYSRTDSLKRHLEQFCKVKQKTNQLEILQEKYEELLKEIQQLKQLKQESNNPLQNNNKNINIHNTQNNTQNNSINISINGLVEYGKEDLSKIGNINFLKALLKGSGASIPKYIFELIHFNPNYPENHNIYITDMNRKYFKIYNGKKWILKSFDQMLPNTLDRYIGIVVDRLEDFNDILNDKKYKVDVKKYNKNIKFIEEKLEDNDYQYELTNEDNLNDESTDHIIKKTIMDRKIFREKANNLIINSCYNEKDFIIKNNKKILPHIKM
jgi:hypothetical protein